MRYSLVAIVSCLSLLVALPSDAATIRFNFTGTVDFVHSSNGSLESIFDTSQTMTGFYTFESTAPDLDGHASFGFYELTGYSIAVGSYTAAATYSRFSVQNDFLTSQDFYFLRANPMTGSDPGNGMVPYESVLSFAGSQASVPGDSLPLTPPDLSSFLSTIWRISFLEAPLAQEDGVLGGTVTSSTLASVPDGGATIWLFGLAAAGLTAIRRRL